MDEAGQQQERQGRKWFQDWRWVASVAAVFFALGGSAFAVTSIRTGGEVDRQTEILEEIKGIAGQNTAELDALRKNQEGIEELLEFVRAAQGEGVVTREEIQHFFELLCASTDPLRNEACDELRQLRQEQGASL